MSGEHPLSARLLELASERPEAEFLMAGRVVWTWGRAAERVDELQRTWSSAGEAWPLLLTARNRVDEILYLLAAERAGLAVAWTPTAWDGSESEAEHLLGPYFRPTPAAELQPAGHPGKAVPLPPAAFLCLPTSGSTGRPRWALRSAASLLAEGERYRELLGITADDRLAAVLPLGHAFSLGFVLGSSLAAGAAIDLLPRFTPRGVAELLRRRPVTFLPLVPSAARLLVSAWGSDGPPRALRRAVVGAGPLDVSIEGDLERLLGRRPARNYGSTETGATLGTAGEPVPSETTGAPLPGVEAAVQDAGTGGPGALFVRTAEPFLGYLQDDGLDTSRISPDGWMSTGDLACRNGPWLQVMGRLGGSLRRGSQTVQPAEVEAVLRGHPRVRDAVVVGCLDGRREEALAGHIEVTPGPELTADVLHRYVASSLADYKVPTLWRLYETLPRTAGGKPDRSRLLAPSPNPRPVGSAMAAQEVTELLQSLAAHRLSSTVGAAHGLGLLARLERGAATMEDLTTELQLGLSSVESLLEILAAASLVEHRDDGTWRLLTTLPPSLDDLVRLENHLRHALSASAVEEALRSETPATSSVALAQDLNGFESLYLRVMGGAGPRLALRALRRLDLPPGPVADIGRPAGDFAAAIGRREPHRPCGVHSVPFQRKPDLPELEEPLAALYLYNCVRYLCAQRPEALHSLTSSLAPGGWLVIADIFTDSPSSVPWLKPALRLDWICFGSELWPHGAELRQELETLGLEGIESLRPDSLFDLILARRPKT